MVTIARLTFVEASRKKMFLVTILLSLVFLVLYGVALDFTAREMLRAGASPGAMQGQGMVIRQVIGYQLLGAGLYFASFLLALLALLASVGSIASEIESGLLQAIISKPLKRSEIVLGKFLGYGVMLSGYALVLFAGVMALNMVYNYQAITLVTPGNLVCAGLVFMLQPLVLLGVALFFSVLLRTLTAGIVSVMLYGLGAVGGFLEQIGSVINNPALINTGIVTSLIMPSDALFRKLLTVVTGSDANPLFSLSVGPFGVSSPPSNLMLAYTILYIVGCIGLTIYSFERKDL
ncbi:MAG: ABC transporter permease subunit [Heliobacteriaceae bacterium]|nr:ABC transporter permease subunit [Heliobacteriaceae bacterium]